MLALIIVQVEFGVSKDLASVYNSTRLFGLDRSQCGIYALTLSHTCI